MAWWASHTKKFGGLVGVSNEEVWWPGGRLTRRSLLLSVLFSSGFIRYAAYYVYFLVLIFCGELRPLGGVTHSPRIGCSSEIRRSLVALEGGRLRRILSSSVAWWASHTKKFGGLVGVSYE